MKRVISCLGAIALVMTNGCISAHLVNDKARPHQEYIVDKGTSEEVNGKPGYYALLPLTVAGDVATSPFQLGYFMFKDNSHRGSVGISGVPVPLP